MFKIKLILLFLISPLILSAQFEIEGQVVNNDLEPLPYASIVLLNATDSSVQTFAISDEKGSFKLNINDSADYLIQFSFIGKITIITPLIVSWSNKKINIGKTILQELNVELKTVNVEPELIPIKMKEDTLIYDAEAFETNASEDVESLLELLPGISLDKDGNLIAQGKVVRKVLVDGKEFFGNDPKLATKNLDAEAIKRIEVINKKMEEAEFTGVDNGVVEKTINLSLKEEYKKGQFGRAEVAAGTGETYQAKVNVNRYNKNTQTSIIGNTNNLNETSFSFNNYIGEASFKPSYVNNSIAGINESYFSGINLSHELNQKMNLNVNYLYKNINNKLDQTINSQYFSPTTKYKTVETIENTDRLNEHSVEGKLWWKIDSLTALIINTNLSLSDEATVNKSNTTYLPRVPSGSLVTNELHSTDNRINNYWNIKLNRNFNKNGRNLLNHYVYVSTNNELTNDIITSTFGENLDQFQVFTETLKKHQFNSTYTEPLNKKWFLNTRYTLIGERNTPDRLFIDRVAGDHQINDSLSGEFKRVLNENKFKLFFVKNSRKINLNIGAELAHIQLKVPGFNSSFQFIYPSASVKYSFQKSEYLDFKYSSQSIVPNINQLITIPNNTNPNQNYVGNPNLNPEYRQNISLNYFKFDMSTYLTYYIQIDFLNINNKILNRTIINNNLTSSVSPVNTDFYQSTSINTGLSGKLKKLNIDYRITPNYNFESYDAFLNTLTTGVRTENTGITIDLGRGNKGLWGLKIGLTYYSTQTEYDANSDFNQRFNNLSWYAKGELEIIENLIFKINYTIQGFNDVSFSSGRTIHIVNASLMQTLKNGRWLIYLTGNDILNQNIGLKRSSGMNSLSEDNFKTRTQFFMLGISRRLKKRQKSN